MKSILDKCIHNLAKVYHIKWVEKETNRKISNKQAIERYVSVINSDTTSLRLSQYPNIPDKYKKIVLEKIVNDEIIPAHIEIDLLNLTFDQLPMEYQNGYKKIAKKAIELILDTASKFHDFWLIDNQHNINNFDYQQVNKPFNELNTIFKSVNTKYLEDALYILKKNNLI